MRRMWLLVLTSLTMVLTGVLSGGAAQASVTTEGPAIPEAVSAAACGVGRLQGPSLINNTLSSGYLVYNNCRADAYARVSIFDGRQKSLCFKVRGNDAHLFAMAHGEVKWSVERCSSGRDIAAKPTHGNNPCIWRVESAATVPPGAYAYTVFNGCNQTHNFRLYFPGDGLRTPCVGVAAKKYAWLSHRMPTGNWVAEGCTR